jgi:hypothetical protein
MKEQQILASLGFPEPYDVHGRSSIADLIRPKKRCGIYVLHFSTGEYYAGLSRNVTARYAAHQRNYDDIVRFSYKQIPEDHLDVVETETIHTLEREAFKLRNIIHTSIPKGESDFDLIMPDTDQERWLHDFAFIDDAGPRLKAPDLRRNYHRKYERLMKKPKASDVVQILRTYVQLGIPAIRRGELDFWSVSCLPGKDVYARINVNWQEVCAVYGNGGNPVFALQIAESPLVRQSSIYKLQLRFQYPFYQRIERRWLCCKKSGYQVISAALRLNQHETRRLRWQTHSNGDISNQK